MKQKPFKVKNENTTNNVDVPDRDNIRRVTPEQLVEMGENYFVQKKYTEAFQCFHAAAQNLDPKDVIPIRELMCAMALCAMHDNKMDLARQIFEEDLMNYASDSPTIGNNYAVLKYMMGDMPGAADAFENAIVHEPNNVLVWKNIIITCLSQQQTISVGLQTLFALTQVFPEYVDGWLLFAHLYRTINDYTSAEVIYKKVLSLEPDNAEALHWLEAKNKPVIISGNDLIGKLKALEVS
jgi:Tfp pilus assembly protein PilF